MLLCTGAGAAAWPEQQVTTGAVSQVPAAASDLGARAAEVVSRSAERVALQRDPVRRPVHATRGGQRTAPRKPVEVVDRSYLTTALNVWTGPGEDNTLVTVLPTGAEVAVTGRVDGAWAEILHEDKPRWVRAAYLSDTPPQPEPEPEPEAEPTETEDEAEEAPESGGLSQAPCASGSAVEEGLTSDAIRVHRAVCAQFPEVSSYGGVRSDGEHAEGRALDIMVSDQSLGDAIAEWLRANSQALGVSELLWAQRIWTVERSSEGWRAFEDRGSATANHYDHVHVTVYGN